MRFHMPNKSQPTPTVPPPPQNAVVPPPPPPPAATITSAAILDGLPRSVHHPNWPAKRLPNYLLFGRASEMDWFAARLVENLHRRSRNPQHPEQFLIGWAHDAPLQPGQSRPLRIRKVIQPGHIVCTDVHFYTKGPDLGIQFFSRARTPIVYYRWAMYAVVYVILFTLGCVLYLSSADHLSILAREFAGMTANDGHVDIQFDALRNGANPFGYVDYLREDPATFLRVMGTIPGLLAAGIGIVLRLLPPDALRLTCGLLGSVLPERFEQDTQAHDVTINAAMDAVLLQHSARLTEANKNYIDRGE